MCDSDDVLYSAALYMCVPLAWCDEVMCVVDNDDAAKNEILAPPLLLLVGDDTIGHKQGVVDDAHSVSFSDLRVQV